MSASERTARGKAVQVEHISLTLDLKALGFQLVESASPFKVLVSDVVNLHPYIGEGVGLTNRGKGGAG